MRKQKTLKLAKARGVEVTEKPNGHLQLKGALMVNYYPDSKMRTAYVAGTVKGAKNVTPQQAIDMCFSAPKNQGKKDKRKGNSRTKRQALLSKGVTCCRWCKCELDIDNSTLEHIIPLERGGLDNANNRTLACGSCNSGRGSNMPELEVSA